MGTRKDKLKELLEILENRVEFPLGEYTSDKGPLLITAQPYAKPSRKKPAIGIRGTFGSKEKLRRSRLIYDERNR